MGVLYCTPLCFVLCNVYTVYNVDMLLHKYTRFEWRCLGMMLTMFDILIINYDKNIQIWCSLCDDVDKFVCNLYLRTHTHARTQNVCIYLCYLFFCMCMLYVSWSNCPFDLLEFIQCCLCGWWYGLANR